MRYIVAGAALRQREVSDRPFGRQVTAGPLSSRWAESMPHKFKIGQLVDYHPPRGIYAPRGPYLIAAQLPMRDGEFEYQIRHSGEMHERIAPEGQLSIAKVTTTPSEIIEYKGYRLDARPLGKGWRVLIYPPGAKTALSEYASDLEMSSKEAVVRKAKEIVDAHLNRTVRHP